MPGARSDVDLLYRSLDIFVLPSLNEGISNTLLEAMASQLPVVATAVGGNVELVTAGVNGQLVQAATPSDITAAIGAYIADDAMRLRHGRASRATAVANFSIDAMVDRYLDLYDTAMRGRS
jgi:glycosyltransferase involved in cell wall biosynthesis